MKATIIESRDLYNDDPLVPKASDFPQRILAEGDSWFSLTRFPRSSNLLRAIEFSRPTALVTCAWFGDVMTHMADRIRNADFYYTLRDRKWDALFFSGGGNDLIDAVEDGHILRPAPDPASIFAADWVNDAALDRLLDYVERNYRQIIGWRDADPRNRDTPFFFHSYDYPAPRPEGAGFGVGPWLCPAVTAIGAPLTLWNPIADLLIDRLGARLRRLEDPARRVFLVPLAGTLVRAAPNATGISGEWVNEIHPSDAGFVKLGRVWRNTWVGAGYAL